jgi:hypothetical protein
MMDSPFEHAEDARAALRAIIADPGLGSEALSNSQAMANLLRDLLPDAPRESGVIIAAASAGLPAELRDHVAQGMDVGTATNLAASSLAGVTAFPPDVCQWVAVELACALGLAGDTHPGGDGDPAPVVTAPTLGLANVPPPDASLTLADSRTSLLQDGPLAGSLAEAPRRHRQGLATAVLVIGLIVVGVAFEFGRSGAGNTAPPVIRHLPDAVLWNCYGHRNIRPDRIVLACADGNLRLDRLRWSKWTATLAMATGRLTWNNCIPMCASGKFLSTPARVTLSAAQIGPGRRSYFTQMLIKTARRTTRLTLKPDGPYGPY